MSSLRVFCVVESVQHIHRVVELGDIDHAPLTQHMQTNLVSAGSDVEHGLEIRRHQTALHGVQLKARLTPRFHRNVAQIVDTGADETERFHGSDYIDTLIIYQSSLIFNGTKGPSAIKGTQRSTSTNPRIHAGEEAKVITSCDHLAKLEIKIERDPLAQGIHPQK